MSIQYVKSAFDLWIPTDKVKAFEKEAKNLVFKRKSSYNIKSVDEDQYTDISIVSAQTVDVEGDLVIQSGINWSQFKNYKVPVLYGHEGNVLLPVGKSLWQRMEGINTIAKTQYAKTSFAMDCYLLVKSGFLNGKSIGFTCYPEDLALPSSEEEDSYPGVHQVIKRCDIHEYSCTSTPCNKDAMLQSVKSLLQPNTLKYLNIVQKEIIKPVVRAMPPETRTKTLDLLIKSVQLSDREIDELYDEVQQEIIDKYSA